MKKISLGVLALMVLALVIPFSIHAGKTKVFVGGSFWVGPPPYWGPPSGPSFWGPRYYYGAPVFYGPPPVVVPQPPVYIQRGSEDSDYWYYCENPQGFYPYIKSCPGGWLKVVPETVPPDR
jgi:hypothetical protein